MPLPVLGAPGALDVVVFGPGFGESIVVRTADDEWLVVDSLLQGRMNPALELLRNHGRAPRLALLTHPHLDHCEGFSDLLTLDGATVAACAAPFMSTRPSGQVASKRARSARHEEALTAIRTRGTALTWSPMLGSTAPVTLARTTVTSLYPPASNTAVGSANRWATPLLLCFGSTRVLLGADLARAGWSDLSKQGHSVAHHGLKVPHHGSDLDHHESWLSGSDDRCWVLTPWRLGSGALPRLAATRDIDRLRARVGQLYLSFLSAKVKGVATVSQARAAMKVRTGPQPPGMKVEAVLDAGRADESWVWASFDGAGGLSNVQQGADALVIR